MRNYAKKNIICWIDQKYQLSFNQQPIIPLITTCLKRYFIHAAQNSSANQWIFEECWLSCKISEWSIFGSQPTDTTISWWWHGGTSSLNLSIDFKWKIDNIVLLHFLIYNLSISNFQCYYSIGILDAGSSIHTIYS